VKNLQGVGLGTRKWY